MVVARRRSLINLNERRSSQWRAYEWEGCSIDMARSYLSKPLGSFPSLCMWYVASSLVGCAFALLPLGDYMAGGLPDNWVDIFIRIPYISICINGCQVLSFSSIVSKLSWSHIVGAVGGGVITNLGLTVIFALNGVYPVPMSQMTVGALSVMITDVILVFGLSAEVREDCKLHIKAYQKIAGLGVPIILLYIVQRVLFLKTQGSFVQLFVTMIIPVLRFLLTTVFNRIVSEGNPDLAMTLLQSPEAMTGIFTIMLFRDANVSSFVVIVLADTFTNIYKVRQLVVSDEQAFKLCSSGAGTDVEALNVGGIESTPFLSDDHDMLHKEESSVDKEEAGVPVVVRSSANAVPSVSSDEFKKLRLRFRYAQELFITELIECVVPLQYMFYVALIYFPGYNLDNFDQLAGMKTHGMIRLTTLVMIEFALQALSLVVLSWAVRKHAKMDLIAMGVHAWHNQRWNLFMTHVQAFATIACFDLLNAGFDFDFKFKWLN